MKNKNNAILIFGFLGFYNFAISQCFISGFGSLGQLYKSTGNYALDNKFNVSKVDLESVFGVSVELYVYNDGNAPNAYATRSKSYLYDGLVAFGTNMLVSRLWRMDKGEYAVAGVLAHEFAHVLQIKKGNTLPTKLKELQADFLAGYYFGKRSYLAYGLQNFATDLFELGDYNFWHPQHHGTPQERVDAMVAGYNVGYKSIYDAYQAGLNYVRGNDDYNSTSTPSYEDCSNCDGEGEIARNSQCAACYGTGVKVCYSCNGNGGYYSNGYNIYGQYGYWWYTCNSCGGSKKSYCSVCSGVGTIVVTRKCNSCNGSGRKKKY